MRLWTIQPLEVVNILNKQGIFVCNEMSEFFSKEFKTAYDWLVKKMDEKGIFHPNKDKLRYPIWAWHTVDWKREKPDLRRPWYDEAGVKRACLEIEIPDNEVLLSDFDLWHYVLNKSWIDNSTNMDEFVKMHVDFDKLPSSEKEQLMMKSWDKIFTVTPINNDWTQIGRFVQATFWVLKKENVKKVQIFTCR